jgi:uncharacterized protein YjcR
MTKSKAVNWAAIKAGYLQGATPKALAEQYGVSPKQVSNKAQAEGWVSKKQQISANVADHVENDLKALCDVTLRVHTKFMRKLEGQLKEITNPYLLDGERTNSLYQTAMNKSVKLMLAAMKGPEAAESDTEPPGFIVNGPDGPAD